MIPGYSTWEELGAIDGAVLLVINSPRDHAAIVSDAARELHAHAPDGLHVIAPPSWQPWITDKGIASERVRYAATEQGGDIELNHFLETAGAIRWVAEKRFAVIAGSEPHSLYNDEVKAIFEQRIALLVGDGCLLTHALPERGLYLFDGAGLIERFGRASKQAEYQERSRALLADLHSLWTQQGEPGFVDNQDLSAVTSVLSSHLGAAILEFDETGPIPLAHDSGIAGPAAEFVRHLHDVIRERDERTAAIAAQLESVQNDRGRVLSERNDAVAVRDRQIASYEHMRNTPFQRLRRWFASS